MSDLKRLAALGAAAAACLAVASPSARTPGKPSTKGSSLTVETCLVGNPCRALPDTRHSYGWVKISSEPTCTTRTCVDGVSAGAKLTITAGNDPSSSYAFASWRSTAEDACAAVAATKTCTLTVKGSVTVIADFKSVGYRAGHGEYR